MPTRNNRVYNLLLVVVDCFVLLAAFVIAYIVRVSYDDRPLVNEVFANNYLLSVLTIIPFWIAIFAMLGLYQATTYRRRFVEWSKLAVGTFIGILLIIGWDYVSGEAFFPARLATVYAFFGSLILLIIGRELLRTGKHLLYRYNIGVRRVLLVGSTKTTTDLARALARTNRDGYVLVAIAGPGRIVPDDIPASARHYSRIEEALKHLQDDRVSTIVQTDLYENPARNQLILGAAQSQHLGYSFIPGESEFYSGKNTVDVFHGYPMINVHQTPLIGWGAI